MYSYIILSIIQMFYLPYITPSKFHPQRHQQIISGRVSFLYGAFVEPDSSKKILDWKDIRDFRVIAGGPVSFQFKDDSTILQRSGRGEALSYTYKRMKLTPAQQKNIPSALLKNEYKLLGVFYEPAAKGDNLFIAYYSNGKNLLTVWHERLIGFVIGACYYSNTKVNDFKNANYYLPYRNKVRF